MTTMTTIRLDDELLAAIDSEGRRSKLTRAHIIRAAILDWLEQRRAADAARCDRAGYDANPIDREEFGPVLGAQTWPNWRCEAEVTIRYRRAIGARIKARLRRNASGISRCRNAEPRVEGRRERVGISADHL